MAILQQKPVTQVEGFTLKINRNSQKTVLKNLLPPVFTERKKVGILMAELQVGAEVADTNDFTGKIDFRRPSA